MRAQASVERHAVAFFNPVLFQHVGKLAHLLVQLAVGEAQVAGLGVVGLEDDGELVGPLLQVPVEAVLGEVERSAGVPSAGAGRRKLAAAHSIPLAAPGKLLGSSGPESIGVFD
jgi:hypothetical protein